MKLSKSVLSKLVAFSVAMGACVGATALPASAAPADEVTASDTPIHTTTGTFYSGAGVTLGREKVVEVGGGGEDGWTKLELSRHADGSPDQIRMGRYSWWQTSSAKVAYSITHAGQPTPYWIQVQLKDQPGESSVAACEVFAAEPGTAGAEEPAVNAPFTCKQSKSLVWARYGFVVEFAALAEASGTITSTDVSLRDGVFRTDSAHHQSGDPILAKEQSTRFDAILLDSDHPFHENQARTEWAYQIVDNEVATGVWVAGLSTNYRGWSKFSADGRCAIYDHDPLAGGARLDDTDPVQNSTYTCSARGEFLNSEDSGVVSGLLDRHFDATFTVSKK